jgi:hypothetical protein
VEEIIVALIGVLGAILITLIEITRKENKKDHGYVVDKLDVIEDKIDNHISDHVKSSFQNFDKGIKSASKEVKYGGKKR